MRCSRYVWFLTLFMTGFPLAYLLFAAFIFELRSKGILDLVLSPLFYVAAIFWMFSGFGIRNMRKWSWYTFVFAQILITYLNALNLVNYSESEYRGFAFAVTLLIQCYVFLAVYNEIHVPYLFPRIRWWESGLAGMTHLPVDVMHVNSVTGVSTGQVLDLNPRGCFVKIPQEFESLEKIKVRFDSYGHQIDVAGTVLWNAKSSVTHPKGIGVRFQGVDRKKKRKLRIIAQRFIKQKDQKYVAKKVSA